MADQLEILSEHDSFALLRSHSFGRLAVVVDNVPLIFPVNYAVDDDAVVIRTASGTKFDATENNRVSFEVDEWDPTHRSTWSVVVVGKAFHAELIGQQQPHPVVPGDKPWVVRIVIERITGRRLKTDADSIELDPHGYL